MKKNLLLSLIALLIPAQCLGTEGEALWQQLECRFCHAPYQDQLSSGGGPALAAIAAIYDGDEEALLRFLKGQAKPRVAPENYMVMETQLAMILGDKPEENLRSLVRFIFSHPIPVH